MSRKSRRRRHLNGIERRTSPGASPGSLVVDPQAPPPVIRLIGYGPDAILEQVAEDLSLADDPVPAFRYRSRLY